MTNTTCYKINTTNKGFTLVELAIVLVIIGLIVSSVLVGQDLIKAAQLRATTRQFQEFQVGVNTFIGKYNGIPGDMTVATATTFGLTGSGAGGDGDGTIESLPATSTIATYVGEVQNFWSHLTTSGKELISGTFAGKINCTAACTTSNDFPAMKIGSAGWGVYGVSGVNYLLAGATSPTAASATAATATSDVFIPLDAYNIDAKIDDGLPASGDIMAGSTGATFVATLAPAAACVTSAAYVLTTATAACNLQFKLQTF